MSPWLLAGLATALALAHMARPRFERRRISAARFFLDEPPAREGRPRFRIANPVRSRPLLWQLPFVALLCLILYRGDQPLAGAGTEKGFGVWIMVDTSGSMLSEDEAGNRMNLARTEVERVLDRIEEEAGGLTVCIRLSSFDGERIDLVETQQPGTVTGALEQLRARPLGTDLRLVRAALTARQQERDDGCRFTHLVVISDQPAPDWGQQEDQLKLVWRRIGSASGNVGFSHAEALRDPLLGLVRQVRVTATRYGTVPGNVAVTVTDPNGTTILETFLPPNEPQWRGIFTPNQPGTYQLQLTPGGSWNLDDRIQIIVDDQRSIRVDWQLPDRTLPNALGWEQDARDPHLRVLSWPATPGDRPTLIVGNDYGKGTPGEVGDFIEGHPMLRDLNLDVAERLTIAGIELPEGYDPVLRSAEGRVWLAANGEQQIAYVPGLPQLGEDNAAHFSATAFFNGIRFLLGERPLTPLYELTSPGHPEVIGNRLAIHEGEGNTARQGGGYGTLTQLEPVLLATPQQPRWPQWLALAAVFLVLDRLFAAAGGARWR